MSLLEHIRPMTRDDLHVVLRLREQNGWNQLPADIVRLLELPGGGGFVAELQGQPVGTVMVCTLGSVGWISMMLVDESCRGRGLGKLLMRATLEDLDRRQVPSVRLDATPAGRPLYEKLGFRPQFDLARFSGRPSIEPFAGAAEPMQATDLAEAAALDEAVTGTPRQPLLERLWQEHPNTARVVRRGRLVGYMLRRPGARATQIGPAAASDAAAGAVLLSTALQELSGQDIFIDVPLENRPAVELLRSAGLSPQRTLTRMVRGREVTEVAAELWASSGPEKG